MQKTYLTLSSAAILALAACATNGRLSGDDLRDLLADGLTLELGGPGEGYTGEVRLEPDGTGTGSAVLDSGQELDITGTWEIVGNQFCRKWAYDDYKRTCETWKRVGSNRVDVLVGGERIGTNSWSN